MPSTFTSSDQQRRARRYARGASLAAVGLVASACGGSPSPSDGAAAPSAGGPPPGMSVDVSMTDFRFDLSRQAFAAGTYTFVATNDGEAPHAVEVVGPGVDDQRTDTVAPGETAEVTVTLQPGSYELYCPVGNHRELGMTTMVTVG